MRALGAALLAGMTACAGQRASKAPAASYPRLSFAVALVPPVKPQGARVRAVYVGGEEAMLDLPDAYADWARVVVADPENRGRRHKDVVAAPKFARRLRAIKPGDTLELKILRVPWDADQAAYDEPGRDGLWVVEAVQEVGPGVQPEGPEGFYRDLAEPESFVRLYTDGRFEILDRGKSVAGSYSLQNETLSFILANGAVAKGSLSEGLLIDPSGKSWHKDAK